MSNTERAIRMNVGIEIIDHVFKDLCHESTDIISREETADLCDLIIQLRKFSDKLKEKDTITENKWS